MSDSTLRVVNRICQERIARNREKAAESERNGNRYAAAFYSSIQERYERVLADCSGRVPPPGTLDTLINLNIEESQFDPGRVPFLIASGSSAPAARS
jgi:hypothetical protein